MNTVPRPSGAPESNPEAHLRAILAAVAEALAVPMGDDVDAVLRVTRDRAILVRGAALNAVEAMALTGHEADRLRAQVDTWAPLPDARETGGAR